MNAFAWLAERGLTGAGVPRSLGGAGGRRDEVLNEIMHLRHTDAEAAAALASHQCVLAALLAGRNTELREHRVPTLARGIASGIWPSSAVDDMLHRGTAAVQALATGRVFRLNGPLGRVNVRDRHTSVLVCPVQWSAAHPPGLALLDGEAQGLRVALVPPTSDDLPDATLASLDDVLFRVEDLVDADGTRIVMSAELRELHSVVRGWLERST